MSDDVQRLISNNKRLIAARSNWDDQWQSVGEWISQVRQDFERQPDVGEFLNDDIFDSTGTFAAKNASSALLGMLWPSSAAKSIQITPPSDMDDVTDEEREWYEKTATRTLTTAMDDPSSNLALALDEYLLDQFIFGTSGVGAFWEDDQLLYRPFGVKQMVIDEGRNGRVNTVYMNYDWTLLRVVETYGLENISAGLQEKFNGGKVEETRVKILVAYQPRLDVIDGKEGNLNMPFKVVHMEVETLHKIKEGGFEEFPIQVGRFRKLTYEKYGRSPAMDALPDVREINALREAIIVATEKILDPPLGLFSDGMLGGGVVDTSSGALNVFDVQSNVSNSPPIFPINTVGDMSTALARIEELKDAIAQHFAIDRLLDFNNQTQMTATETAARGRIRNASLSSLITRQIVELFTPLIERSFNIMLRHDQFGFFKDTAEARAAEALGEEITFIPDRIAERMLNGKNAYDVRYTTPADRVSNAEELDGMIQTIQLFQQLMQTNPEAQAFLDVEEIAINSIRLFGAPPDIIRSEDEVKEIQEAQQERVAQQEQLNQGEQVANIAEKAAKAENEGT